MHEALGSGRFARITVLTRRRFSRLPRPLHDAVMGEDPDEARFDPIPRAEVAVIHVGSSPFEREAVFWNPARRDLLPLASALHARGVRHLQIVLAQDLTAGERRALDQLGFERWALSGPEQVKPPAPSAKRCLLQRCADWMIGAVVEAMQTPASERPPHFERGQASFNAGRIARSKRPSMRAPTL